jgi:hypothetical protein
MVLQTSQPQSISQFRKSHTRMHDKAPRLITLNRGVDWHRSAVDIGKEIKIVKWEHVTEEHYKMRKEMRAKSIVVSRGVE